MRNILASAQRLFLVSIGCIALFSAGFFLLTHALPDIHRAWFAPLMLITLPITSLGTLLHQIAVSFLGLPDSKEALGALLAKDGMFLIRESCLLLVTIIGISAFEQRNPSFFGSLAFYILAVPLLLLAPWILSYVW
jgi:hypothetical protein